LLTTIYENVPMYSREVDEIWHEMLMFTREYEAFSQKFIGRTLHHAPNVGSGQFDREQRAWFDMIYVLLFRHTAYSDETLGRFFRHPLAREVTDDFQRMTVEQLTEKYFQSTLFAHIPALPEMATAIITQLQSQLQKLAGYVKNDGTAAAPFVREMITPLAQQNASQGMWLLHLFLSIYYYEKFESMRKVLHKSIGDELKKREKQEKKRLKANKTVH
jgi:hypothetical protein